MNFIKRFWQNRYLKRIKYHKRHNNLVSPENEHCPVCGYYCLGRGGWGCIDKPTLCGYNINQKD